MEESAVADHLSRKELKHDAIKETIEHGAEAVWSHSLTVLILLVMILLGVASYSGWTFYHDRQNLHASAAFDSAMKVYTARIGAVLDPTDPNEILFKSEADRSVAAQQKFTEAAQKYPRAYYGQMARYYSALCLEDLDRSNQALEELSKIENSGNGEVAALAHYQAAVIYSRTGKHDEAVKVLRTLAEKPTVLVPRPMVLLELARLLANSKPQEAASLYQQIKKEFPNSAASEEAERGLETLGPKS
jgi:hypothetical protein